MMSVVTMMPMVSMVSVMPVMIMMAMMTMMSMMLLHWILIKRIIRESLIAYIFQKLPYCWPYPWLWFKYPFADSIMTGVPPLLGTWTVMVYWKPWGCPMIWRKWLDPAAKFCDDYSTTRKLLWYVPNIWLICCAWEPTKNWAACETPVLVILPCW